MKRVLILAALTLFALPSRLDAQSAEEQYVRIFHLIQEADGLKERGQVQMAVDRYLQAQGALKTLQTSHPNWNERVVNYRLGYISSRLEPLARQLPATNVTAVATVQTNALPADPDGRIQALEVEIGRLAAQKALLEAKLREALSARPAAADPLELAKAHEQLRTLQKENDVLRVTVEQEREKTGKRPDMATLDQERQVLAVVQLQLAQQSALADALRKENDDLKNQAAKGKDLEVQLISAQTAMRSLEREKTDLNKQLGAANRELAKRSTRAERGAPLDLERENEMLRSRLTVLEAERIPYTEEEMALLKQATLKVSLVQPEGAPTKKKRELPPGAVSLMAEAERAIDKGKFDEAERKYLEVLRLDESQVNVLSRLAAVQLDQDRLSDADATLQKALAIEPQDAPCLYLLGSLRFRQGKYDEAFTALSSSARLNPDNPQVQYFLGKTLLQKGNRGPAETALRKAVQLQPGWGGAHHLLAVVYATQQPPFKELAQWHYQKALDGGYPRDNELEKRMEANNAAPSQQ